MNFDKLGKMTVFRRDFTKIISTAIAGKLVFKCNNSYSSEKSEEMFRGNASHTFYGDGIISDKLSIVWKYEMGGYISKKSGKLWTGTGWTGTAVVHGENVYIGSLDRRLYCFNKTSGKINWIFKAREMFKSSVAYHKGRIFIGNVDNHLYCINAKTGDLLWKYNTGNDLDSSPTIWNDKLFIGGECGWMHCFRPDTGSLVWRTFLGGIEGKPGSNGVESTPAIWNNRLYASNYNGELFCLGCDTGKILWKTNTGDDTDVSPVVYKGVVYTAAEEKSPYVFAFDALTGKLIWKFGGMHTGGFWSTPAVKGDYLWIGDFSSTFYCLKRKTGKPVWKHKMKKGVWSSPALVGNKIIYGSYDEHLYVHNAYSGKIITSKKLQGRIISSPVVSGDHIFVGTATGMFYCLS